MHKHTRQLLFEADMQTFLAKNTEVYTFLYRYNTTGHISLQLRAVKLKISFAQSVFVSYVLLVEFATFYSDQILQAHPQICMQPNRLSYNTRHLHICSRCFQANGIRSEGRHFVIICTQFYLYIRLYSHQLLAYSRIRVLMFIQTLLIPVFHFRWHVFLICTYIKVSRIISRYL